MAKNSAIPQRVGWVFVICGLVLPWVIRILAEWSFHPRDLARILKEFPALLFAPGHNLFLLALLNGLPFLVVAVLGRLLVQEAAVPPARVPRLLGVIAAGLMTLGLSCYVHLSVWMNVFGPRPSSTAGIAFVFLPLCAAAFMVPAYGIGWLTGKTLFRLRPR